MQKNWLLITVLILILFNCLAQDNNDLLILSVGPSFPVDIYGSRNSKNNSAGFEKTGEVVTISYNANEESSLVLPQPFSLLL